MAGRPAFVPTKEQREDVTILVAARVTEAEIAHRLDIDEKTLRKHFRAELDSGFVKFNTDVLIKIGRKIKDNPKKPDYEWWFNRIAASAPAAVEKDSVVKVDIGKKEQRIAAAAHAGEGSDWADDLRPPTVN